MGAAAIAAIAAVVVVAAVAIALTMRKKPALPQPAVSPAPSTAAGGIAGSTLPLPPGPVAAPPAPLTLDRVSCLTNGAMHGAMPPFGRLSCDNGVISFEATSRVVSKAGGLGDDGSSTLQSLGAIEMGRYRFEIPVATVQRVDFGRNKATVHADAGVFEFEGIAVCGAQLQPWFAQNGLAD